MKRCSERLSAKRQKRECVPEQVDAVDEARVKGKPNRPVNEPAVAEANGNDCLSPAMRPPLSAVAQKVAAASARSRKCLGAHVSAAGGVENAVTNAAALGCRSFAMFTRNQRAWVAKPLADDAAARFRAACQTHGYAAAHVVPHGSYLLNAGSTDADVLRKTREALVDEAHRCEALGLRLYNFHPGSTCGKVAVDECIATICASIDLVLQSTSTLTILVETMARQGNTIGGTFEELRAIIDGVSDRSRVGVCLDTCHIFAAGYDIRTPKAYKETMKQFSEVVGFEYLKAVHLNDSKGKCGDRLDRHEVIGRGQIGSAGFANLMNDERFNEIPMVLETPEGTYDQEMLLLYSLESTE